MVVVHGDKWVIFALWCAFSSQFQAGVSCQTSSKHALEQVLIVRGMIIEDGRDVTRLDNLLIKKVTFA